MGRTRRATLPTHLIAMVLLLVLASCGESSDDASVDGVTQTTQTTETSTEETAAEAEEPAESNGDSATDAGSSDGPIFSEFDVSNFDDPTTVDNPWLPLTVGHRLVLEGTTTEDGETFDHRLEFTVTDLRKEIAGVETVVAWIEDISDGELVEAELAFYAQDNDGTVWFLGEYPEEYEDGEFLEAPAWIAGVASAKPGIKMYPNPELGTPAYFQGWGPEVEWSDYGKVDAVGESTCVELDCYEDVLIIAETSLGEEGAWQLKSYAKGVGNVQVGFRGDDATSEELEVIEYGPVSAEELIEYRATAREMEAHAYEVSPGVYGQTPPLQ